jgi:prenyltransferase/squalene oxidase-like repeat protein
MRLNIGRLAPLTVAACALLLPTAASAKANRKQTKKSEKAAAAYLEGQQTPDGGFETDWVINSLAAAGVAAADVKTGTSPDARSWYRGLVGEPASWEGGAPAATDLERATLNSYAAGIDPARVSAKQNLIAGILADYQTANPGYYGNPTVFGGTIFGLLALAETRTTGNKLRVPQTLLAQTVATLRANQHSDGGWTFQRAEGNPTRLAEPSEPDETGATIAGLCSAGVANSDPTITSAVQYLQADQLENGAFNSEFGVNTDSNAWAVQGLDACGIDAQGTQFTTATGATPIDFLLSQQVANGGFKFAPEETEAEQYETQDALRSLAGAGFTAAPAKPTSGAPKWLAATSFQAGTQSHLALIVDDGTGEIRPCSVPITVATSTTTLLAVLQAAQASSTPAGCVSSFMPTSGTGALTQLDGSPASPAPDWDISIDGAKEKQAKLSAKIEIGDTISLKLG